MLGWVGSEMPQNWGKIKIGVKFSVKFWGHFQNWDKFENWGKIRKIGVKSLKIGGKSAPGSQHPPPTLVRCVVGEPHNTIHCTVN